MFKETTLKEVKPACTLKVSQTLMHEVKDVKKSRVNTLGKQ